MLYIPIMNAMSTAETRADYLHELKRAGAVRVYLALAETYGTEPAESRELALLRENLAYYAANGIEPAVWINGLGHGGALEHEQGDRSASYTRIRGLSDGGEAGDSFCPLDEAFTAMYTTRVRRIAQTGAKILMIDDDLRMSMHGACRLGCACPLHMREFNRRARSEGLIRQGEELKREDLYETLFGGKPNALRSLWLRLQGDTMRDFCRAIRRAADEVDPAMRIGQCACLTTWDTDGEDAFEIARILAGQNEPFLRGIGAPYWRCGKSFGAETLGCVIDDERMELAWREKYAPDIKEMFTEGDLYPRPRYRTPFMYAEDFDQVLLAEHKADAILKYMLDYTQPISYEMGYIDRHLYFKPLRDALDAKFANRETAGVYIRAALHRIGEADCTGLTEEQLLTFFSPASIRFANAVSLPSSYTRTPYTAAALLFGENARHADEDTSGLPLILDAYAAELLQADGVDVGLLGSEELPAPAFEEYPAYGVRIPLRITGSFRRFTLAPSCEVLSRYDTGAPAAYRYMNAQGRRFLVYAFDAERTQIFSDLTRAYPRQCQLFDTVPWLTGAPLPVRVDAQPSLYPLVRRRAHSMAVGLWNFSDDIALPEAVLLDRAYADIRFIGETEGRLEGDRVYLTRGIMPYAFAGFVVSDECTNLPERA